MKRSIIWLILALVLVCSLSIISMGSSVSTSNSSTSLVSQATSTGAGPTYHWRWYGLNPVDHFDYQLALNTAQEIKDQSNGRIVIDVYPAGQLGDWIEANEQIARGSIEMGCLPIATNYDPRLEFIYLNYLVRNYAEAKTFFGAGGSLLGIVNDIVEPLGIKVLGTSASGMGGMALRRESPDPGNPDVQKTGYKIRVPPGFKEFQLFAETMGYETVSVPYADVYISMQTGVIDGALGGPESGAWSLWRDVMKEWVHYVDHFEANFILFNKDLWDSLSATDQQIVSNAVAKNESESFRLAEAGTNDILQKMRDKGIKVTTFDDAALQKIADVTYAKVWPQMADRFGTALLDKLMVARGLK